jgi:hypothetical protein
MSSGTWRFFAKNTGCAAGAGADHRAARRGVDAEEGGLDIEVG